MRRLAQNKKAGMLFSLIPEVLPPVSYSMPTHWAF